MSTSGVALRDMTRTLHARGLRETPQRRLVLRLLREQGGHPSADEVYQLARLNQPRISLSTVYQAALSLEDGKFDEVYQLARLKRPRISLSTVYRALDTFEELGLVRTLHLEGEHHRYEIAGNGEHHHMICLGCGRVIEFECSHCADTHQDLAQQHSFQITGSQVQLLGYCAGCQARDEGRES